MLISRKQEQEVTKMTQTMSKPSDVDKATDNASSTILQKEKNFGKGADPARIVEKSVSTPFMPSTKTPPTLVRGEAKSDSSLAAQKPKRRQYLRSMARFFLISKRSAKDGQKTVVVKRANGRYYAKTGTAKPQEIPQTDDEGAREDVSTIPSDHDEAPPNPLEVSTLTSDSVPDMIVGDRGEMESDEDEPESNAILHYFTNPTASKTKKNANLAIRDIAASDSKTGAAKKNRLSGVKLPVFVGAFLLNIIALAVTSSITTGVSLRNLDLHVVPPLYNDFFLSPVTENEDVTSGESEGFYLCSLDDKSMDTNSMTGSIPSGEEVQAYENTGTMAQKQMLNEESSLALPEKKKWWARINMAPRHKKEKKESAKASDAIDQDEEIYQCAQQKFDEHVLSMNTFDFEFNPSKKQTNAPSRRRHGKKNVLKTMMVDIMDLALE